MGLAMGGDVIIASESAKFMAAFFRLGVIPDLGMMYTLPRLIGLARAKRFFFMNETLSAREAYDIGLVSRVVPADRLLDEALAAAQVINRLGGPSMMAAKECVNRAFEGTLADGVMYERRLFHALFGTEDRHEGMDAFLNKRKPEFTRR